MWELDHLPLFLDLPGNTDAIDATDPSPQFTETIQVLLTDCALKEPLKATVRDCLLK